MYNKPVSKLWATGALRSQLSPVLRMMRRPAIVVMTMNTKKLQVSAESLGGEEHRCYIHLGAMWTSSGLNEVVLDREVFGQEVEPET